MSERAKAIDEAKLGVLWIDALNRALGPAEALRFLALFHRETTDYVEVSKSFTKIRVWKKSSSKARYQRTSHTPARSWVRQQLYAEGKFSEITGPWWSPACYLGAKVEDLTPKTKLQSYYEHDYESFLAVLKRN